MRTHHLYISAKKEDFLPTTTGVPRRTATVTRGNRISTMAVRTTTTTRTTKTTFGLCGVSDKPGREMIPAHLAAGRNTSVQLELFPDWESSFSLEAVFEAYAGCRKHKRNTRQAREFEMDYESRLIYLWQDITAGTYRPGPAKVFIVTKPVKREIFAAQFRDRIVHHLIIHAISPVLERDFIYDSYACRIGKGTHFGIERAAGFIRSCSRNYTRDAWVMKLDIKGFFMAVNRALLYQRLEDYLRRFYHADNLEQLLQLCFLVICQDPTVGCTVCGSKKDWEGLPYDKSLFYSESGCGLPIGSLTSQVFANFYLSPLDHYIKHTLGFRYYGRYVDDMIFVHENKSRLTSAIPLVRAYLADELRLQLHPKKIYLQPTGHGVTFLGVYIRHRYTLAGKHIRKNFKEAVEAHNAVAADHRPNREDCLTFQSSINAYLGILRHSASYRLRKKVISRLSPHWKRRFSIDKQVYAIKRRKSQILQL